MANATFYGQPFNILGGIFVPLPVQGDDKRTTLSLPILLYSKDEYDAFQQLLTHQTFRAALGSKAGKSTVHDGSGAGTLSVPTGEGLALQNFSATLIGFAARKYQNDADVYCRADCVWLILSEVNP